MSARLLWLVSHITYLASLHLGLAGQGNEKKYFIANIGSHVIVLIKVNVNLMGALAKCFCAQVHKLVFNRETLLHIAALATSSV